MRIGFAYTAYRRPDYLLRSLRSWDRAWIGWDTVAFVEPGNEEVEAICRDWRGAAVVNDEVLGPLANPYKALSTMFAASYDFVVLGEDDAIVAPDTCEYLAWAAHAYREDEQTLWACAFNQFLRDAPAKGPFDTFRAGFTSTVWGLWRESWELLAPDWDLDYRHKGWDWRFNDHWCAQGYRAIRPAWSRSQHIGQFGGAHMEHQQFAALQSDCFIGEPEWR